MENLHSIEKLSEAVLKAIGADPCLVDYRGCEILTTKAKHVDISKAQRDPGSRTRNRSKKS